MCHGLLKVGIERFNLLVGSKHQLVAGLQFVLYLPPLFFGLKAIQPGPLLKVELVHDPLRIDRNDPRDINPVLLGSRSQRLVVGNVPLSLDVGEALGFQPFPFGIVPEDIELGLPLGFPSRVLGLDAGGLQPRVLDFCLGPRMHVCRVPLIGLHAEADEGHPAPDNKRGEERQERHGQQHEQGKEDSGPAAGIQGVFVGRAFRLRRMPVFQKRLGLLKLPVTRLHSCDAGVLPRGPVFRDQQAANDNHDACHD